MKTSRRNFLIGSSAVALTSMVGIGSASPIDLPEVWNGNVQAAGAPVFHTEYIMDEHVMHKIVFELLAHGEADDFEIGDVSDE